jgi:transposase
LSISLDLRKRILKAYADGEGSIRKLSKRFCEGTNTIFILLKRYQKTGVLEAVSPPGRTRKIDKKETVALKKVIEKTNDLTLKELCMLLAEKTSVIVSVPTMYRACERMNLGYKKNAISSRTKKS